MGQDAGLDRLNWLGGSPRLRSSGRPRGWFSGRDWWAWSTCTGESSCCRARGPSLAKGEATQMVALDGRSAA